MGRVSVQPVRQCIRILPQTVVGIEPTSPPANAFALSQNFPNPFNPSTTIRFTVPDPAYVELRIFDVTGRTVRTLLSESRDAGAHTVSWDGRNDAGVPAPSGTYVYELRAGAMVESRKLVLLK
jgi:hypothetical protein